MTQKTHHYTPSKFESRTRREPAHNNKVKVEKARDQDWKRETTTLEMFGYTNPNE